MDKKKWYLIVNPAAGNGKGKRHWSSIQELLKKTDIQYDFGISEYAGHTIKLAEEAVLNGYQYIAAVGGDGTANEIINGICQQDQVDSKTITFAMIPVGTGNDWIKTHKIPNNYKKSILLMSAGHTQMHDIGKVFYHTPEGKKKHRYYLNVAGLAYDAYVTKATQVRPRWGNSQLYYLYLIVSCVTKFKPSPLTIHFDGQSMKHAFYNITVGQCKYNGGGTMLVPHADSRDGLFALTLFKDIAPWEVIVKAPKFYTGSITKHKEAFTTQAKHIMIEADAATPAFVEVDGEYLGQTPIEFVMQEHAINIIVP